MRRLFQALLAGLLLSQVVGLTPCSAVGDGDSNTRLTITKKAEDFWRATPTNDGSYLHDFLVDFYLTRDEKGVSYLRVVETINATFPERDRTHGLVRVIPFTNQDGTNLTMASDRKLELIASRNGQSEPVAKVEPGDGHFKVYLGDADRYLHGEQVYTLEYEFEDVITDQSGNLEKNIQNWQELYWDTNGNDWGNSFDKVVATLHMDSELAKQYLSKYACYVGKYGVDETTRCEVEENADGTEITFSANHLDSYENLSFVLAFQPDTFVVPENPRDYSLVILLGVIALSGGVILVIAFYQYNKTVAKRKYYKNLFVKPEYAPMPGVTVAEMAENSVKSMNGSAYVATLMELAVTKKIAIHRTIKEGVLKNKNIWSIEVLSDDLLTEQRDILKILNNAKDFEKGEQFELKKRGYDSMARLLLENFQNEIKKRLQSLGLFESDAKAKKSGFGAMIAVVCLWDFVSILALLLVDDMYSPYRERVGGNWIIIVAALIMFAVPMIVATLGYQASKYQKRTEKGLEAARYLEGLRLYVKMAETQRIKFLQSVGGVDTSHQGIVKLYEKLLPYAIIFGLEKSWLNEMSRYYEFDDVSDPVWYFGAGAFVASDFKNAVSEMSSFTNTSIAHSTTSGSSSSSSGFSSGGGGGGFSGGGGGGGGGGTW